MDGRAAVVEPERRDPIERVVGEIGERVRRAVPLRVGDHRRGQLAAIERVAMRRGDLFERGRHRRAGERLAGKRRPAARHEMFGEPEVVRQHRRRQRPFFGDDRRHRVPVARIADGGLEQVRERQRAIALRQRGPSGNGAWDGDRFPPALRHRALAGVAGRRHRGGRAARCVETCESATVPDDREKVAAEAVAARLDDGQRDRGRERRVDGIAAALEHPDARLGGERLRGGDRIAGEDRLPPGRVGHCPVEVQHGCIIAPSAQPP